MKNLTTFYITLLMASLLCFTPAIYAQAQFVLPLYVQLEKMSAMESTSNILFLGLQAAGTIPSSWNGIGYLSQYPVFGYVWVDPQSSNFGIINVLVNPNFVPGTNGWLSFPVALQGEGNGLICIVGIGPQITLLQDSQLPLISSGVNLEENVMQLQMLNPINNFVPTVAASFVIFQQPSPTCSTGLSMGIISAVS
ncbi:MAG: hypothetical protein WBL68_03075 [Nitrososphaeraceae archaeon]